MKTTNCNLKAYFIPYLAPSHYIPLFQFATLFASRGVDVKFLTTPHNSLSFRDSIESLNEHGLHIELEHVDFPSKEVDLPEGIENFSLTTTIEMAGKVFQGFLMLQAPMEAKIRADKPDFIVSDMHFFWTTDLAAELGIPRLIYHARACFPLVVADAIDKYTPHEEVQSDHELFLIPKIPHEIYMSRSELPIWIQTPHPYAIFSNQVKEADRKCYGALIDTFYDLEKDYIDYYRTTLGQRAFCLGPLFLHNDIVLRKAGLDQDKIENKKESCLEWLDTKPNGSVVYVSFGTLSRFSSAQLFEIASALEASDHPFIWVVRKKEEEEKEGENWLPEGFEERISKKSMGIVINGWAPQAKILDHPATGGVVIQCGWNSLREAITAGLPVVAWPLSSEQFYHRRLLIDVLKIGVDIGNKEWSPMIEGTDELVGRESIEKAVREMMSDHKEAMERRQRAKVFSVAAKKAVEDGGSSYNELTKVIDELERFKAGTKIIDA